VEDSYLSIIEKEEAKFDAVISTEGIEHLYSPHLLPQFASGILKPSGVLIITTPYHGFWKNLALSLFNKWDSHHTPLWHGGHVKFWSKATLSLLLEDSGYEVVEFSGVGRVPYLWKSMLLIAKLKKS
jgi:2-polyprenyl-3-methyl-5-hydroxy-6-metoxy-1,4-benzoquinol methylase